MINGETQLLVGREIVVRARAEIGNFSSVRGRRFYPDCLRLRSMARLAPSNSKPLKKEIRPPIYTGKFAT